MNNKTIAKTKDDILKLVEVSNGIDDGIIAKQLDIDHLRINQLCLELEKAKHVSIQPLNLHSGTKLTILYLTSTPEGNLHLLDLGYTKAYKLKARTKRLSSIKKIVYFFIAVATLFITVFATYNSYQDDKLEKKKIIKKTQSTLTNN